MTDETKTSPEANGPEEGGVAPVEHTSPDEKPDAEVDTQGEDSFPASDPPANF